MNEQILDTLANVAIALAGFSGLVVVFRASDAHTWSPTELRVVWFLVGDSFLVVFLAMLPIPLALANWSPDAIWGLCSALLGSWFFVSFFLALIGELRDRAAKQKVTFPGFTPILYGIFYGIYLVSFVMGILLWLSVWNLVIPRGLALYVVGLMVLLAIAALEFLFFIAQMAQEEKE